MSTTVFIVGIAKIHQDSLPTHTGEGSECSKHYGITPVRYELDKGKRV